MAAVLATCLEVHAERFKEDLRGGNARVVPVFRHDRARRVPLELERQSVPLFHGNHGNVKRVAEALVLFPDLERDSAVRFPKNDTPNHTITALGLLLFSNYRVRLLFIILPHALRLVYIVVNHSVRLLSRKCRCGKGVPDLSQATRSSRHFGSARLFNGCRHFGSARLFNGSLHFGSARLFNDKRGPLAVFARGAFVREVFAQEVFALIAKCARHVEGRQGGTHIL